MGYSERLLSTGERITHREKQHWFVFVWGARYTILAIIIAAIAAVLQVNLSSPWREILGWAAAILFIGGLLLLGLDDPAIHQPGIRADQPAGHPGRGRP